MGYVLSLGLRSRLRLLFAQEHVLPVMYMRKMLLKLLFGRLLELFFFFGLGLLVLLSIVFSHLLVGLSINETQHFRPKKKKTI